jgi:hypothetical protein
MSKWHLGAEFVARVYLPVERGANDLQNEAMGKQGIARSVRKCGYTSGPNKVLLAAPGAPSGASVVPYFVEVRLAIPLQRR